MNGIRTPELIRVLIVICLSVPVDETVPVVLPGRCECARDSSWSAGAQKKQCSPLPCVLHSLGKAVQASGVSFRQHGTDRSRGFCVESSST